MLKRFLLYGVAGWVAEVLFTGVGSAVRRDRSATAKTYLWMHPIYGGTALLLEQVAKRMKRAPLWARGLAYTGVIYAAEYGSGWLLRRGMGKCPWDYSGSGRDFHGLVRLDYAPAWYALGLLFEPLHAALTVEATHASPLLARQGSSASADQSRSGDRSHRSRSPSLSPVAKVPGSQPSSQGPQVSAQ